jgi:very-short-patch-repair endonuclease
MTGLTNYIQSRSESPIEHMLASSLLYEGRYVWGRDDDIETLRLTRNRFAVSMQYPVGRRRLDMALFFHDLQGRQHRIDVECDGWKYHSSNEAMRRDAERDREISAQGFLVWRYPGWLIHRAPGAVADEIEKAMLSICAGEKPIMPFLKNRTEAPSDHEFEAAFKAFQSDGIWPNDFGDDPKLRGWEYLDQIWPEETDV